MNHCGQNRDAWGNPNHVDPVVQVLVATGKWHFTITFLVPGFLLQRSKLYK